MRQDALLGRCGSCFGSFMAGSSWDREWDNDGVGFASMKTADPFCGQFLLELAILCRSRGSDAHMKRQLERQRHPCKGNCVHWSCCWAGRLARRNPSGAAAPVPLTGLGATESNMAAHTGLPFAAERASVEGPGTAARPISC